jgi:uncharacterized protein (DUF2141 family)
MFRPFSSLHIAVILCLFAGPAFAGDLEITIQGLRNSSGEVSLAIFDKPQEFPRGAKIQDRDVAAKAGDLTIVFKNLKPGRYALAIHHDENTNQEMDTNFIGLPLEGYGFSNNARVFFGPPTFEAASFEMGSGNQAINLRVVY